VVVRTRRRLRQLITADTRYSTSSTAVRDDVVAAAAATAASDVNKIKFFRPRPRPPEVNKGTWRI